MSTSEEVKQRIDKARARGSTHLDLSRLNLHEIPGEVFELQRLKVISAFGNKIRIVPPELAVRLPNLQTLDLTRNPIERVPDIRGLRLDWEAYLRVRATISARNIHGISIYTGENQGEQVEIEKGQNLFAHLVGLSDLRYLFIGVEGIAYDATLSFHAARPTVGALLDRIGEFKQLTHLILFGILLDRVPEGIRLLKNLTLLGLIGIGLHELPGYIADCWRLRDLSLRLNELHDLPATLAALPTLRSIDLSVNHFARIPDVVFSISSLNALNLECRFPSREGQVTEIPSDILRLVKLKSLGVYGQPITTPPPEVVENGVEAIKNYWRQQQETGIDYLCEAKLLIVGEAGAGKTSLANKIRDAGYQLKDEKSTEGIEVIQWQFPAAIRVKQPDGEKLLTRDLRVNIWDFGGQEVYHSTHQFFLTRRSLYVLVADDRKEDTNFDYWLQVVELLSGASPLIIVQNEKQGRRRDINIASLRARFENLRGSFTVDLADNRGLEELLKVLQRQLEQLPHMGSPLPKTWRRVREALENDARDYIGVDEYFALCKEQGFERREDMVQLSGYLHDLGICLHFQDDPVLRHTVILKPKWGTDAVYRVLDDDAVIEHRGRFDDADLARIWSETQYAPMLQELLRLMRNFELCYTLGDGGKYIAPQLLSPDQPVYQWNYPETLAFRYEYDFMPKGIITRLIVALNRRIANQDLVWKTGVVLERNDTRAEVIEDYARRRITVRVAGADTRGLLAIIDEQLDRIHESFPKLKYDKFLPCNCDQCRGRDDAFAYTLANLRRFAQARKSIQCQKSMDMVDAAALIRDIFPSILQDDVLLSSDLRSGSPSPVKEVFVSYSWSTESSAVVNRIESALKEHDIRVIRDKNEMKYKDAIGDFMRNIGRGKAVVVVLSKAYLESKSCMFELGEIAANGDFRNRVFPIVLPDAKIYDAEDRLRYIGFWEQKIAQLKSSMQKVGDENLQGIREDLDLYGPNSQHARPHDGHSPRHEHSHARAASKLELSRAETGLGQALMLRI